MENNNTPKWALAIKTIITPLVLPLVVLIVSISFQMSIQEQSINRDYVQIAISILTNPKSNTELRSWATKILNAKSPIPFQKSLFEQLGSGQTLLPFSGLCIGPCDTFSTQNPFSILKSTIK